MVLQVSQVSQEIPEEMVCLDPVVLLARKANLGREEPVVLQVSQVFQEILEEMADLGHVVLLGRKGSLVRERNDYEDLVKSNWKQCVWKRKDSKDTGLIQV